jgi:hypothetical protein
MNKLSAVAQVRNPSKGFYPKIGIVICGASLKRLLNGGVAFGGQLSRRIIGYGGGKEVVPL